MLDSHGYLPVAETKRLLQMLRESEDSFRQNLAKLPAEKAQYFRRQADELTAFLNTAIELAEAIWCSL
jgi:hypothetical protein